MGWVGVILTPPKLFPEARLRGMLWGMKPIRKASPKTLLDLYFDIPKVLGVGAILGFLVPRYGAEVAGFCFAALVVWCLVNLLLAIIGKGISDIRGCL